MLVSFGRAINFASQTHNSSKSHNCDRRDHRECANAVVYYYEYFYYCLRFIFLWKYLNVHRRWFSQKHTIHNAYITWDVSVRCPLEMSKMKSAIGNNSKHIFVGLNVAVTIPYSVENIPSDKPCTIMYLLYNSFVFVFSMRSVFFSPRTAFNVSHIFLIFASATA